MFYLSHPLDWWVEGGYKEVIRQTGWTPPKARREVHKAIRKHGWSPVGHKGYQELRAQLQRGAHLNHELT